MFMLGNKVCNKAVYQDGVSIRKLYKDSKFLTEQNTDQYIADRNRFLVLFLCGVTGLDLLSASTSSQRKLTFIKTLECIYHLRNFQLVLPFSFLENLIQSIVSGSKIVSMLNGKTAPGGSYSTYKSWITDKGLIPLRCMGVPIDLFFDNIGKYVIKNYRISIPKTRSADVITTGIQIELQTEEKDLQKRSDLKPVRIYDIKKTHKAMNAEIEKASLTFRTFRYNFVKSLFNLVQVGDDYDRSIDTNINVSNPRLSCIFCYQIRSRITFLYGSGGVVGYFEYILLAKQ